MKRSIPAVIPTLFVRIDDEVFIHGSPASSLIRYAKNGNPICVEATLVDGVVLARSGFHHSINYRSVVIYGVGRWVEPAERRPILDALVDKLAPGRNHHLRPMTRNELAGTAVIGLPLDRASAKMRCGGPVDDPGDYELPIWAGVVPVETVARRPVPDSRLAEGIPMPDHIEDVVW